MPNRASLGALYTITHLPKMGPIIRSELILRRVNRHPSRGVVYKLGPNLVNFVYTFRTHIEYTPRRLLYTSRALQDLRVRPRCSRTPPSPTSNQQLGSRRWGITHSRSHSTATQPHASQFASRTRHQAEVPRVDATQFASQHLPQHTPIPQCCITRRDPRALLSFVVLARFIHRTLQYETWRAPVRLDAQGMPVVIRSEASALSPCR